jgi:CelD/BcsL family acetyltransferase involved in cellulose biosynthesis
VATEIHAPDLSDLPRLLDTAFEVEASSWKGAAGMALLHDAHRAAFYRQYAEAACVEGTLRICFLRIGDRVAAMQLAIEEDSGFWLLKVGYDARFAACSPGVLLMRDTIRYAAEAGLTTYEFLGRAEAWTQVWTTTERRCVSLRVYPLGVRGLSALAADAAVSLVRTWSKKPCV